MPRVQTGLERLIAEPQRWIAEGRIGLLCNPASVDSRFTHARLLIDQLLPQRLKALYSPQHGFFAEKQDNMIESEDMLDPVLNIPIFSLYGKSRKPDARMFEPIDVLLVDLQDVGTRVYTFIYTLSYCMEAAREYDVRVIILDRPNPVGGVAVEGNCLAADCASFVGRYSIPMRHGLTIGELAVMFNEYFEIGCRLEVIPMSGWHRKMLFTDTGLTWVAPSPNLPTPVSALVYPGQVLWEGTNVSEGRGTTQPFELFGAPFIDVARIQAALDNREIPGAVLRPVVFEPTSNKWRQAPCRGFQIHVPDPRQYQPYATTLRLLRAVMLNHPDQFEWKSPPYEYEFERMPIDLIIGDREIRRRLEHLEPIDHIEADWQEELNRYKNISRGFYLYS
ncbi:MAG: DUF1343 domain-containing protein [Desulfobacterales bacterium]|nr:MAG: DUF1343 domain-containing protein [Desulfobacterales bacterium]